MDEFQRFPARAHDHHMASAAAADGSASPVSPARSPVTDRTVFRFVQRNATAITIAERPVHISRHPRSNGRHHAARNSMNYAFEWNSSKLPRGRNTEIRENQSLLSKIWPDATKLLDGFYGRPRQNILSPDNIDPGPCPHGLRALVIGGGRASPLVAVSIAPATLIVAKRPACS